MNDQNAGSPRETQDVEGALGRLYNAGGHLVPTRIELDREDPDKLLKIPTRVEWQLRRNLSTTMGHSTGLIREQCPVW